MGRSVFRPLDNQPKASQTGNSIARLLGDEGDGTAMKRGILCFRSGFLTDLGWQVK